MALDIECTFPIDKSNILYGLVDKQLKELSKDGIYLESSILDLSRISFAFPDISNGVANFTLEEASNRRNCAFVAFAYDKSAAPITYFAKCQFRNINYEIVACSVEPKRYYIYNNDELIGYFDAESDSNFPFSANFKKEYSVYAKEKFFGQLCLDSEISLESKITFRTENKCFKLPICSSGSRKSELQQWWDILSLRWLDFGIKSNKDLIIKNRKIRELDNDQQSVLFVLALIVRSYFVWEANEKDYYL